MAVSIDAATAKIAFFGPCRSRIRCQAATGSWTRARQEATHRPWRRSARVRVVTGERQGRAALQRRVRACRVVVNLELGTLPVQVTGIPEQYVVEEFSPHRPDQALHEGV